MTLFKSSRVELVRVLFLHQILPHYLPNSVITKINYPPLSFVLNEVVYKASAFPLKL